MKFFLTSAVSILLAFCKADEADTQTRNLRRPGGGSRPFGGGGGSGRPGRGDGDGDSDGTPRPEGGQSATGRLQSMIDTKCPTFACNGDSAQTLDCTFSSGGEPERPDVTGLDENRKAELRDEFRVRKEECRQNMLKCACCADMSAEEILAAQVEHGGSRPFGGGGGSGGKPSGMDSGGRPGMGGSGGGSRPQGSGGGAPGAGTIDDEDTLAEMCPGFLQECANMPVDLDCAPYDSVTSITKESRSDLLYCRCCRD